MTDRLAHLGSSVAVTPRMLWILKNPGRIPGIRPHGKHKQQTSNSVDIMQRVLPRRVRALVRRTKSSYGRASSIQARSGCSYRQMGGLARSRPMRAPMASKLLGGKSAIILSQADAEKSNRWARAAPFFLMQGVTGSVYAWSVFNEPLTTQLGVVAASSADWGLGDVLPLFSVSALMLGAGATAFGPQIDAMGPRASAALASACWGTGLALSALACQQHSLPLLVIGYGVLGGLGWTFGYIGPISGLLAWFPDRRGLLQGLGMMSFGLGSLAAPVLSTKLIESNRKPPEFLGDASAVDLVTENGVRFANVAGEAKEVVVATASDAALGVIENGVYVVGTGDAGVAATFATLGACYSSALAVAAATAKLPPEGFTPPVATAQGQAKTASTTAEKLSDAEELTDVTANEAIKTPQFWYLLGVMGGNAFAGLGIISSGKLLMSDCFAVTMPEIATAAFCAAFVSAIASANTVGRLGWAVAGDYMGRKRTLVTFALSAPVIAMVPWMIEAAATNVSLGSLPLMGFVASLCGVITCYGGLFSVMPAYVADIFGPKYAASIMGRLLCGYSAAAVAGPGVLAWLRSTGDRKAVENLASKVNPAEFEKAFGSGVENLGELWEKKTVTIQNLLTLLPPETIDPTFTLYSQTFYVMAGVLGLAGICSTRMGPLSAASRSAIAASRRTASKKD